MNLTVGQYTKTVRLAAHAAYLYNDLTTAVGVPLALLDNRAVTRERLDETLAWLNNGNERYVEANPVADSGFKWMPVRIKALVSEHPHIAASRIDIEHHSGLYELTMTVKEEWLGTTLVGMELNRFAVSYKRHIFGKNNTLFVAHNSDEGEGVSLNHDDREATRSPYTDIKRVVDKLKDIAFFSNRSDEVIILMQFALRDY